MRTVDDIIRDAGGAQAVADHINGQADPRLGGRPAITVWAVHKWRLNGIPEKHWPALMRLAEADAATLYAANRLNRAPADAAE